MSSISRSSQDDFDDSNEVIEKGKCTNSECGEVLEGVKEHMLTHVNERPQKCTVVTCDYHQKGFVRKYYRDKLAFSCWTLLRHRI
jgi:5'-3' exonuclease